MENTLDNESYNSSGVDITALRSSLHDTVMLAVVSPEAYDAHFRQIVIVQSVLSDDDGNRYALTLDGKALPVDLIEAVQSPSKIMADLKWAVAEND